eukprot:scaffold33911_cov32-Tisochrysis_lutea.AAC.5
MTERDRVRKAQWRSIDENRLRENELRRKRYNREAEAHRWRETMPCPICDKILCRRYIAKHILRRHPQALELAPSDPSGQGLEALDGTEPSRPVELDASQDVANVPERLEGTHHIDIPEEDDSSDRL